MKNSQPELLGDILEKVQIALLPPRNIRHGHYRWFNEQIVRGGYSKQYRRLKLLSIYVTLCLFSNKNERESCYPSVSTISDLSGVFNRNTLIKALQILEAYNIITIESYGQSSGRSNRYYLIDPRYWLPVDSPEAQKIVDQILGNKSPP